MDTIFEDFQAHLDPGEMPEGCAVLSITLQIGIAKTTQVKKILPLLELCSIEALDHIGDIEELCSKGIYKVLSTLVASNDGQTLIRLTPEEWQEIYHHYKEDIDSLEERD